MEWKTLNKLQARKTINAWMAGGEKFFFQRISDLDTNAGNLNESYSSLRKDLLSAWKKTLEEIQNNDEYKKNKNYLTDLFFGARMFKIMEERGMDVRYASLDDVWIYIGVCVVPEITFERWSSSTTRKDKNFRLPEDHYYKKSVRIYLKSLWWYLYLSMQKSANGQDDLHRTVDLLKGQNTDTLLQLVERSGTEGYRVGLYREIMRYYCTHSELSAFDFRKALILNTAKCRVLEPGLNQVGYENYVKELFHYFDK